MLELVLILFTINTWIVIKKNASKCYDYVYQTENYQYKMGEVKQMNIKNRTYYFYNDIIDIKNFNARSLKLDKKSYKDIGIYNIGYITIKKIMIVKKFTVWILCIHLLIMRVDTLKKKVLINIWFLTLQMKIKSYWKNTMMFGMELRAKSKK